MRKCAFIVLAVALALFAVHRLEAQNAWEGEEEEESEGVRPGLQIRADSNTAKDALREAARKGGSVVLTSKPEAQTEITRVAPQTYSVKAGDTLWGICSGNFGDPYVWPEVWSYNPNVSNPNWIYPGDVLRLNPNGGDKPGNEPSVSTAGPTSSTPLGRAPETILLRNRGFVDTEVLERSGTIVGSHKYVQLLSQYDEAYVEFGDKGSPRPGDEYSVFEILGPVQGVTDPGTEVGKLVEIYGLARVTTYDTKTHIARVVFDESIRPIERGAVVGPMKRKFDVVPAVVNDRALKAHVVALLDPGLMSASQQVVFVDAGSVEGVRPGNRFFAIEQRDTWRESWNKPDDRENYPIEIIGELRVVEARPHTSTCLIQNATRPLEVRAEVELRKGY